VKTGTRPDPPDLAAGEVHVWWSRVDSGQDLPASESLSDDERAQAARYLRDRDRRRFLQRREALRMRLASYLGCDSAKLEFRFAEHGKPWIEGSPLAFNLSHSDDDVVIAITRLPAVGIDLQAHQLRTDVDRMARQVFSPAELDRFAALESAQRLRAFFRVWTRKEAILKLSGDGLARDPRTLDIGFEPHALGEFWTPADPGLADVALEELAAPSGATACLAAPRAGWTSTRLFCVTGA